MTRAPDYDRTRQDLGNIVLLEHVNVTIPDQRLATIFYVSGLGLTRDPYLIVELNVPRGTAPGIVRFYERFMGAHARLEAGTSQAAVVATGAAQHLRFRETDHPQPAYDGHHVQVYVADFSGPHRRLAERGLSTEESSEHQYRFRDIVDPASGGCLFTLEHEVRSFTHPLYARPLVNRNPAQSNREYTRGHDAFRGTY